MGMTMVAKINRKFLFSHVKGILFGSSFKQSQVDGIDAILDYWEANYAEKDDRWLAYILGTTFHEAARTMQPIAEYGGVTYFTKMYDPPPTGTRPKVAKMLGNNKTGDGPRYRGRGYVQITGRRNYTDWTARLNASGHDVDLIGHPELALETKYALPIIFEGMMKGTFTSKKLSDYFSKTKEDWEGARSIVNPKDKPTQIAHYGRTFYQGISYTTGP